MKWRYGIPDVVLVETTERRRAIYQQINALSDLVLEHEDWYVAASALVRGLAVIKRQELATMTVLWLDET